MQIQLDAHTSNVVDDAMECTNESVLVAFALALQALRNVNALLNSSTEALTTAEAQVLNALTAEANVLRTLDLQR